jgi:ribonucleoside-diphosphate reductase alpha chain
MQVKRKFTKADTDVFSTVKWTKRSSRIANLDGSVVFEMHDAQVPASWSQLATDIMVSKYFRKAGVPQADPQRPEAVLKDDAGQVVTGPEKSAQQVIHRLAGCWRHWGSEYGYFDTEQDAQSFYDELSHMMLHQMAAPNSPQWFNTGLNWAYGISGPPQGHWITDPASGETRQADDAFTHPQPHACFIQSVEDDLVNPGGIMDLWVREARLFKYGSGTGTNFSKLRGESEPLSGGGRSSGLMSWLKIGDRAAGAIKSGGTTRRAAKMVCLDLDHPDIEAFIDWKVREEIKVAAMVEGLKALPETQREAARRTDIQLDYDFNGEAYATVSGQNSNNSVRIPNQFFERLDAEENWEFVRRTDGKVAGTVPARQLWDKICYAAWRCADPGVQFDTTINEWHTCPEGGRINASNPCSEYMFLDNTACNLASLNLLKFYDPQTRIFDVEAYEHAARLWTIVLEISVLMAAFPSQKIARRSFEFRTLGLGYANIGAMLMQAGIPYDSEAARAISGALTAILSGRSYATSAEMASQLGPFPGYFRNREHMLRVIRNHRRAAYGVPSDADEAQKHDLADYEGLQIRPVPIHNEVCAEDDQRPALLNTQQLFDRAQASWDEALNLGHQHGFRNAQVSVIAPTGTIGLLMDCDTTGVEPDFSLVKFKKLAGGGYFKIANQSVKPALQVLGYDKDQVRDILTFVMGRLALDVPMPGAKGRPDAGADSFDDFLREKGLNDEDLKLITEALPTVFELQFAFAPWALGEEAMKRLGLTATASKPSFSVLEALGLTRPQISALNVAICGTQTVEGAPHLQEQHLAVFDCANTCGPTGRRFIATEGHIRMMAAAQPFVSGAISKTINLPNTATTDDIDAAYRLSWRLGLKANALYRDGCKLSQVLSNKLEVDDTVEDQESIEAGKEEVAGEVAGMAHRIASAATETAVGEKGSAARPQAEQVVERIVERPLRRRLPDTRRSMTHKFNVAGHEGYLTVGLYDNDEPGELFITMAKEGSTIGGLMDSLGTAISIALQYGVPVEALVNKFTHQRFEPAGMTHNSDIPMAKSLVDYIFRWMGMQFVPGYRAANAPRRKGQTEKPATTPREPAAAPAASKDAEGSSAEGPNGRGRHRQGAWPAESRTETLDLTSAPAGRDRAENLAQPKTEQGAPGRIEARPQTSGEAGGGPRLDTAQFTMTTAMKEMQADAPACDVCGTITVRSGTCYKCLNCGNSMGCS